MRCGERTSWRGLALTVAAAVALTSLPVTARADDGSDGTGEAMSPGELGAVTGIGTLMVTSLVGGLLLGRATSTFARDAGTDIAGFGFAAAPLVGHLVNGEYARAAAFTAVPLALAGADFGLMQASPNVIDQEGTSKTRVPFSLYFTLGLTSGVVGIVDTFFATHRRDQRRARQREREREPHASSLAAVLCDLHVLPLVGRDGASLSVGGTF